MSDAECLECLSFSLAHILPEKIEEEGLLTFTAARLQA